MRLFRREVWSYAVLLIILFSIASLAARAIITYIEDQLPPDETHVFTALIWALSLGFMLIAGAFALWAIDFAAEAESRRRIGRFVDAMDYLSDPLIAVDFKGRVTGLNPAAVKFLGTLPAEEAVLRDILPALTEADTTALLTTTKPFEIEREISLPEGMRVVRFRSQPTEDLIIIQVSDVTMMNSQRLHSRQMARLQLIGQLARGVAHDFNNLLSGISGHASILPRLRPGSPEIATSVESIMQASEQGIALAGHLLELSQTGAARKFTDILAEHVKTASSMLRDSLPTGWKVQQDIDPDLPPVSLTGMQIEQMVLNLGLMATDAAAHPGILRISAVKPSSRAFFNVGDQYAAVILISTRTDDFDPQGQPEPRDESHEAGVILSVVRSMMEEAGGAFYTFVGPDGSVLYRLSLPRNVLPTDQDSSSDITDEHRAQIAHWNVLLARSPRQNTAMETRLKELIVHLVVVDNVISVLAHIEEDRRLDAMILDKYIMGHEAKGLLRAILKLHPSAGIVVLCDDPDGESDGLSADVVFAPARAHPNEIITSLINARNLALHRKPTRKS